MALPLLIAGAAFSFYGRIRAAEAEADQLRDKSILLNRSAQDILDLNEFNADATGIRIDETKASAKTKFAQSGFAVDIDSLADIAAAGAKEISINTQIAEREAASRRLEASYLRRDARNTRLTAMISGTGAILGASSGAFGQ